MSKIDSDAHSATDFGSPTMIDLLRRNALHQRSRLAYTFLVDGETERVDLTYGELDRQSRAIGGALQHAGATGERVLLLYSPGLEFIAAFFGCLYAGAIAVPAYPPRLNRSQRRLQGIMEDSQAAVALTTKAVLARVERVYSGMSSAKNLRCLASDDMINDPEGKWREPAINSDTIAMIQYTSGSTSAPKGVMISHRNLLSNELMIQRAFGQSEVSIIVGWLPLYHDMGLIGTVLQPLFLGARCILMSPAAFLQKPSRWLRAISTYRATTSGGPNFAYDLCVRKISPDERARLDLSTWTVAFNGAEPIFHETMERFAETFASCGFRREAFYPCYGLAEATLLVSAGPNQSQSAIKKEVVEPGHLVPTAANDGRKVRVGCGQILLGERVVIVDPESLAPRPDESMGEIWVSGPNVARGYWKRDQETEQTFVAYLEGTGEGPFLRTGDLGYIKDGELFVAGRIKDLIIIRGRNHYPQDIELTVQQSDPALEAGGCAAFSIEQADEERLVIVKELNPSVNDPNSLIEGIREAVAREHEVQAHAIVLINKGRLPKTTSGKIQRYECRNEYLAGRFAAVVEWRENLASEVEPIDLPSTNRLLTIDAIASEAIKASLLLFLASKLRCDVGRISVDKPLHGYGVDSLTAIEVSHHLESRFGVTLPLVSLLEETTIAQLAQKALGELRRASSYSRPAITPAPKEVTPYPLSYGQRSLWFLHQLALLSGVYNVSSAVRIRSALDVGALRRALQKVVDRHDSLRTTFLSREGEPLQSVLEKLEVLLPETDVSSWSDKFLDDYLVEEAHRPFNLEQGPLLRVALFTRSPQDHILFVVAHHIVVDLWSMGVLMHELSLLYKAEIDSTTTPLDPLPVKYADYVYWQTRLLAGPEGERLRVYWQSQLAGDLEMLNLPTDRPRPLLQTFRGDSQPICLGMELTQALKSLGQNHRATLYMTLQAVFHVLLHRYTTQEDILVGSPTVGRSAAELAGLIGYFVNPVVLRADLSGNPTFSAFLERIREVTLTAIAHQDYPFALLVERLQPERDPSRSPLFQVMFALQKAPSFSEESLASQALIEGASLNFGGLSAESIALRRRACYFDLSLLVVETEAGLKGFIEYKADLFDEWRIRRMAEHFRSLAAAVTANPERSIHQFELMSAEEKEQVIVEFNRTEREYEREQCLHSLFETQAARTPHATAVAQGDCRLSYGELNTRANRLAHRLRMLGVGPDAQVAVCVERSPDFIIGLLAILKAGGAYVPLDPAYPAERLIYMLEDSSPVAVLTHTQVDTEIRTALATSGAPLIDLEDTGCWESAPVTNPDRHMVGLNSGHLAYVIYTSGSTGRPKGVMIEHRGLCNLVEAQKEAFRISDRSRVLQFASLSFDASVSEIFVTLVAGGSLHLYARESLMPGDDLMRVLRADQITAVTLPPSVLAALGHEKLLDLQTVIAAGEACTTEIVQRWARGRRFLDAYGPTEVTVCASIGECEAGSDRKPTIGRPIANTQLYILDREMQTAPVGVQGELYIAGVGVARGYLGRPELTSERFIPNHFSQAGGERLYRTGDVGRYLSEGEIEFIGRADEQVKIRGYRIEPGEIEAVLNEHRLVKRSVVLAREDGRGEKRLCGYVEGEEGITAAELRRHVRERLPEYMVPSAIVALEKMPMMANGKLDRRALPAPDGADTARKYEAPVGVIETALAHIWAELLKLERVGRNDHFFERGGHSLLAVKLLERMRREGLHADVRALFATPTLAAMAAAVNGESGIVDVPPNRIPVGCDIITPQMLPLVQLSVAEIEQIVKRVPGGAVNIQDIYPLTALQEGILFHHLMVTEGDVYLTPALLSFDTRSRLDSFLQALQRVIDRHDILRTSVLWEGLPEPVQAVWRQAPMAIEEITIDPTAGDVVEELRARFDPRRYRLDVRRAPLMRVCIAHDAREHRWVMLHLFHHLSMDHTALEILLHEIQAHLLGQSDQLPAPLPFRNFVAQSRLGVSRQEQEAFFCQMLGDVDEPTAPFGLIDVQGDGSGIKEARREVDARLGGRLRRKARSLGVSPASLYHLAWALVLARVSASEARRDDVVFGTILFGRMQGGEGADRAPGLFINTLPIRIRICDDSVQESVLQTQTSLAQLLRHEQAPLVLAQRCSSIQASMPLFSALMNYRHSKAADPVAAAAGDLLPGWEGIKFLSCEERSNYPFTLIVDDVGEGFILNAQAQSPVEPDRVCAYMHTALERLVGALEESPATPVRNLDVMPASERQQLLMEWNKTGKSYPQARRIPALFAEQAKRRPDGIAVKCEQEQISYRELNERANRIAHYLRELGVGPEARVGICLERSVEMVVGLLGILKAGGTYVPMDPSYPDGRLNMMIEDAKIRLLLTEERLAERYSDRSVNLICLDEDWGTISTRSCEDFQSQIEPDHSVYVIYTSGSTGRPKGVIVTHRSVSNLFNAIDENLHFSKDDVWAMFHSYAFDFSVWEIWGALIYGGALVVVPHLVARTPEEFCELVYQQGVTILSQTPSAFRHFIKASEVVGTGRDLSLRAVIFGGEALEFNSLRGWMERHGDESPQLINMYGITETTVHTTYKRVMSEELKESSGSLIGRPLANMRMYVLDERMQPVPVGAVGELYVGGEGMARGYLGREEQTAERFLPAPYGPDSGERIYRTGDLVRYLKDGDIEYLGRRDHQVKIRGYRIELGEVEAALLQHEAISEAVVIAREESGNDKRLVAYLVSGSSERLPPSELRSYLMQKLPHYMVPASFVMMEKIPLTPNGKLDRNALPGSREERGDGEAVYVAPRTPIEEILGGIFEELLKLDRVGVRDNFFEIGGHSLLAAQAVSRVRSAFGVEIGVRSIFEESTIEGLASRIDEAMRAGERDEAPPLVRVERDGRRGMRLPLSFAQQRLWFIDQLEPGSARYNIPGSVRLEGRLNFEALECAINEIVRRHEVLRTRIEVEAGQPVQVIDDWEPRRFEFADLTLVPLEVRDEEISRLAKEEASTGFDLSKGPLLRLKVLKLEEDEHVMLLTIHHIVCDAWSMEVLVREVGVLYEAMSEGKISPLPELEIHYADYAYWQRRYLKDEVLEEHMRYWKKQLGGELLVLNLTGDLPRPLVPGYRGAAKSILLPAELYLPLRALSKREGVSLYMTLLAAFTTMLYKYTAEVDIIIGTSALNRNRAEIEPLIGFFVNVLPMRTDLSGNPRFRELLRRVRETALGAFAHQEMPFEKLIEEIQPERELGQIPLFNIHFGVQNAPKEKVRLSRLKISPLEGGYESARLDLSLWIIDSAEEMCARWTYNTDLFEGEAIIRMHEHFETLLSRIVARPDAPLDKIEMLSEAERVQQAVSHSIREEYNYSRFKSMKPKTVALSKD